MTRITINGKEVEADPRKPLIAACHEHAEHVPMYCYHPGLTPVGSCRICQVEVQQGEMPPRVVVACRTPVAEGMVVNTEATGAHEARKQCLEFLLKNHPLDCPICDKAGECDLQDYSFTEGQGEGRSVEPRRKLEKRKSLGETILLDQERCILYSRCVRFFEDVTEKPQLTVSGLGSRSVISTFMDRPLEGNYQGNVADICPVGALTLSKFRFQARVWNLEKHLSTCGECSRGCSITTEVLRRKEVKRIRPRFNEEVNQYWMCDHGRFSYPRLNAEDRLQGATLHDSGSHVTPVSREAGIEAAGDSLSVHADTYVLVSPWLTVEEGKKARDLAQALGAGLRLLSPPQSDLKDDLLHTGEAAPNRRGLEDLGFKTQSVEDSLAGLAEAGCAVLLGERICEILGEEGIGALPRALRLIVLDTHAINAPATNVCIGVPNAAERQGTWINVDGHEGRLAAAKPAPPGVSTLERTLEELTGRVAAAPTPPPSPTAHAGTGEEVQA